MTNDERRALIFEILENLRRLGLVTTEDTVCNLVISEDFRPSSD